MKIKVKSIVNDLDTLYPYYLMHMNMLQEVADSFGLEMSTSINLVPTKYMDNSQDLNLVLDLMFLWAGPVEFDNYEISPDLQSPLNHAHLSISIIVEKESIQEKKRFIIRNSDKEKEYINKLRNRLGSMETTNITSCKTLDMNSLLL